MTELENCVLGVVWQGGPLIAYEMAKPFVTSRTRLEWLESVREELL